MSTTDDLNLYRFECLIDGYPTVDWVWLKPEEVQPFLDLLNGDSATYRQATLDEEELYDEAYNDGYEVAIIQELRDNDNGITFRMNRVDSEEISFDTTKMFKCARCDNHKDFETEVARAGGLYLAETKQDILWHVCYSCVMLQSEIESVEFDIEEED
jgi:hypothetical protein